MSMPVDDDRFRLIGNVIDGGEADQDFKWGIVIHGSSYGLVRGTSFTTSPARGSHRGRLGELQRHRPQQVVRVHGIGERTSMGREGSGFWFRGPNNYVRDNVAANIGRRPSIATASLFDLNYLGPLDIPTSRRPDEPPGGPHGHALDPDPPVRGQRGLRGHAAGPGVLLAWDRVRTPMGNVAPSVFQDSTIWHIITGACLATTQQCRLRSSEGASATRQLRRELSRPGSTSADYYTRTFPQRRRHPGLRTGPGLRLSPTAPRRSRTATCGTDRHHCRASERELRDDGIGLPAR